MNNKYNRTINRVEDKSSFWPTFTDLLSSVLMVVILILFSSQSIGYSVEQDLANKINKSVKENLVNENIPVEVDNLTGQITFKENALFDVDSDELNEEGKIMLKSFIPKYVKTIYEDYEEYIKNIIVVGHTDDVGGYIYNLDLSQRRALNVAKYIVGHEIGDYKYKDNIINDIEAIGKSKSQLIKNSDGSINRDKSRRVEIKYELNLDKIDK